MSKATRYPRINLRSKNEIAKRISSPGFSPTEALNLLNDVLENFDAYWYDSKKSEEIKGKYVRSAAKSIKLERLLELINKRILAPHDRLAPSFIFGGFSGRNSVKAAANLLGRKRRRTLLKIDIQTFFEQVSDRRVYSFFYKQCGCSVEAAKILTFLSCVPVGKKGSGSDKKILARGFATSSRLAVWCNMHTFQHLDWLMRKRLHGHDPRISIYVDDIGITASAIDLVDVEAFKSKALNLLERQKLPPHRVEPKTSIKPFAAGVEHLGVGLGRKKIFPGKRVRDESRQTKARLKAETDPIERKKILNRHRSYQRYVRSVKKAVS